MTKRMLIDATHAEETRVAVIDGKRLEEFDYESKFRKPLKGSIFLAKVTRVEPSLQAAFVNFGGNRHGFLPFSEIHPDYFRIPIADREALIAEQEEAIKEQEEREEKEEKEDSEAEEAGNAEDQEPQEDNVEDANSDDEDPDDVNGNTIPDDPDEADDVDGNKEGAAEEQSSSNRNRYPRRGGRGGRGGRGRGGRDGRGRGRSNYRNRNAEKYGDGDEYEGGDRNRFNLRRKYKIQEVIKRGQIMLIQVSKEERGNKGAAVSSYLSLPGRYCVLMPNSPRAGGVSRKIANYKDRNRMRDTMKALELPKGMSVIVRTAGVTRTKAEIKRDLDYLTKLWDNIRELTLQSSAPALVYEEADLIKRSVRDLYARDIEEIVVAGDDGFKNAKNFMKMMIPSHVKKVIEHKEDDVPLFNKYKVEDQIVEISEPQVTLPSGGYLIINPTEALVSIDVNSGKSTKERHIEETALRTNLETAEEVARQLRLRDLGGLIVIDFIDMEDRRNNGKVERKIREALAGDRARIQVGRISSFGLMELSRQRLNPSLNEAQFEVCGHCAGTGRTRTADATAVMVMRAIEDEGAKNRAAQVNAYVTNDVALYILNNKRAHLSEIESRYGFAVVIRVDGSLGASNYRVEVSKPTARKDDDSEEESNNKGKSSGRGRGRRGGRKRSTSHKGESLADDLNEDIDSEEEAAEKPEAKEKKIARGSKKKEDDKPKDEKPKRAPSKASKKYDAKKEEKTKKEKSARATKPKKKEKPPSSSNDDQPASPPPAKEYETVNEAPGEKKKGWWSKGE